MTRRTTTFRTSAALAAALAIALLGGCGSGDQQAVGAGTSAATPTPTRTKAASTPSPSPSEAAPTADAGPAACTSDQLTVAVAADPGGGMAGSVVNDIVLTNTGDEPCTVGGFGGVSYVGEGGGQVGAAATRVEQAEAKTVTLAPGGQAVQQVRESLAENYPKAKCQPAPVDGFQVYPPNETHALFAKHATTGCSDDKVALLQVAPYAAPQS